MVADWRDLQQAKKELFAAKSENIVYCVPGHYIHFEDKKKIAPLELSNYQKKHTLAQIGEFQMGQENTFIIDYISGYSTDKNAFQDEVNELRAEFGNIPGATISPDPSKVNIPNELAINTELDYMTVLVISAVAVEGGVTGGIVGYKTGSDKSADWNAGILLVPNKAEILKELKCDILPAKGEIE